MTETETPEAPPPDPVEQVINEIEGESDESLKGHDRLGAPLAFTDGDVAILREIAELLRDGRDENRATGAMPIAMSSGRKRMRSWRLSVS